MKILTVSNLFPRPDRPEMGLYNYQLFRAFAECGHEVINICLVPEYRPWHWPQIKSWSFPSSFSHSYLPAFYLPFIGRDYNCKFYYKALSNYYDQHILTTNNQQLATNVAVYASWLYPDGVTAAMVADEIGVPCWLMVLGSDIYHLDSPARRKVILEACDKVKGIICVAEHLKRSLIAAGIDEKKIHVVENGVDGQRFKYRPKAEALKQLPVDSCSLLGEECKTVLLVGNLVEVKGPDVLIDAFAEMVAGRQGCRVNRVAELQSGRVAELQSGRVAELQSGRVAEDCESPEQRTTNNEQLIIVGSGPMRKKLEVRVRELGIADSVYFLGNRPHKEVALWMNSVDVLCLPSRSEGMPNVLIEALVSGLPAVATDVGACGEMLMDEPYSRVVPVGNAGSMASAIGEMLSLDVDRKAMAERYKKQYSWKKTAKNILEIMKPLGSIDG